MPASSSTPQMPTFSNSYLFLYNALQSFGWAIVFFRVIASFASTKSLGSAYPAAGGLVCLLQSVAFLEVIHGALGIVPSGVLFPLMQWGGRVHYLLAILRQIHEVQGSASIFLTFFAWSLGEVIRYSHYALNSTGSCPYWMTYIRYTAFILVYPVGLCGEMWLMYQALPFIRDQKLYSDAFAYFPVSYYNFVQVLLLFYPFLWLNLYLHLLRQRKSKLGKRHLKKTI